jgi:auxin influx carrier (AUX1 LAX family)
LTFLRLVPTQRNATQVEGVAHTGPSKLVLYFTGATNILYTFGGHAVTV